MNRGKIEHTLQTLGLTEKEAKFYLAALETGPSSVQKIAKAAHVKRPTAYNIIQSLESRGLMSIQTEGFKTLYSAESPISLKTLVEEQQKELEACLPELQDLFGSAEISSSIKCYRTEAAIRNAYEYLLKNLRSTDDYLVFGDLQSWYDSDPKYFEDWPHRRQKIIRTGRSIFQDSPKAREYLDRQKNYQTNVKIIPGSKQLSAIKVITSNFLFIHKTSRPYNVFIIENRAIVGLYKEMFDTLWRNLPRSE